MRDVLGGTLFAIVLTALVVRVTASVAAAHSDMSIPKWLLAGETIRKHSRGALLFELPWLIGILGGGEVVVLLFLLHPASSLAVRFVASSQLAIVVAWLWFLFRLSRRPK